MWNSPSVIPPEKVKLQILTLGGEVHTAFYVAGNYFIANYIEEIKRPLDYKIEYWRIYS